MKNEKKEELIKLRIETSLLKRLRLHCSKYNAVLSKVVRAAIDKFLQDKGD